MKKLVSIFVLAALVLAAGCNSTGSRAGEPSAAPEVIIGEQDIPKGEAPAPESGEESSMAEESRDPLEGLTKDEYDGLEITAAVLVRRAILPGSVLPVTVVVTNNGDRTVAYTQGSGSSQTPQALVVQFDGLQPVLPEDHLGPMTMDFVTKELEPGESIQFVMNVLAVKPNESFDKYTYDLFNEEQTYIANLEWQDLQERYPDLAAAEPGSYEGTVSFRYSIVEGEGENRLFGSDSGYAQAEIAVSVTE